MLGLVDIEPYARERGLIGPRAVVDGGLRIADVSRHNRVFLVTAEGERCLVVKVGGARDHDGIAREAAVLERLWQLEPDHGLKRFLPHLVPTGAPDGVLVLETPPDTRDLTRQHARGRFSRVLAREAGSALAKLHAISPEALKDLPHGFDPATILRIHEPDLGSIYEMSAAATELTAMVQSSERLCDRLDELRASWKREVTIHADPRWANWLAAPDGGRRRWRRLWLIDWELATAGDAAFDVGAFLGEYLRAWLRSIPIADPREPQRLLAHSAAPLDRMRPALASFWEAYMARRGAAERRDFLRRATGYMAAWLLNAALEEAQSLSELDATTLHLLSLSEKVCSRPDATASLLGLGSGPAAA